MNSLSALHAIRQGILICDRSSRILYFNQAYEDYIGVSLAEAKGRKITEYREGAMAPRVLRTGRPVEGILRQEQGQEYFASVYPIYEGEQVNGSISIVTSLDQSRSQADQLTGTLEERVREFERREIEHMMAVYGVDVAAKKRIAAELGISLATLYNKLGGKG